MVSSAGNFPWQLTLAKGPGHVGLDAGVIGVGIVVILCVGGQLGGESFNDPLGVGLGERIM